MANFDTTIPALKITQLTKTYSNGFAALKGIDLTVPQGGFFALLGPNGAGKSTTIGIIINGQIFIVTTIKSGIGNI